MFGADRLRLRNLQARCLGGLAIDHQLEPGRLLDRQVGPLGALADLVDAIGGTPDSRTDARAGECQDSRRCAKKEGDSMSLCMPLP